MFGRTRRKEAERFTRSVVAMRSETRSLEALLEVLSQRIHDSRSELGMISQHLMKLGDEATGKLGGITREFDTSSEKLMRHGEALDRAAEAARTDIAVLLEDLPRAEQTARAVADQLRAVGSESARQGCEFGRQVSELADADARRRRACRGGDRPAGEPGSPRSKRRARKPRRASATPRRPIRERSMRCSTGHPQRLNRFAPGSTSRQQLSQPWSLRRPRASARPEPTPPKSLAKNIDHANSSLGGLTARVAEQDRASQRMIAEIERGLALIDERFTELAAKWGRARQPLPPIADPRPDRARHPVRPYKHAGRCHRHVVGADRALARQIERLAGEIRDNVGNAIGEAQGSADRLVEAAAAARPEIGWLRDAAVEASAKLSATGAEIVEQHERFAAMLSSVDSGVEDAQSKLADLASTLVQVEREATNLSSETGPALIASLVQVKEAAAHAADLHARRSRKSFPKLPASFRKRPHKRSNARSARPSRTAFAS